MEVRSVGLPCVAILVDQRLTTAVDAVDGLTVARLGAGSTWSELNHVPDDAGVLLVDDVVPMPVERIDDATRSGLPVIKAVAGPIVAGDLWKGQLDIKPDQLGERDWCKERGFVERNRGRNRHSVKRGGRLERLDDELSLT